MYPSIKYKLVEKAVNYFAKKLKSIDKKKIRLCLKLIQFGMNSTLMTFQEKYYEYGGGMEMQDKALTIGGYESAWLADLVAAYVLENTQQHFQIMKHFIVFVST